MLNKSIRIHMVGECYMYNAYIFQQTFQLFHLQSNSSTKECLIELN